MSNKILTKAILLVIIFVAGIATTLSAQELMHKTMKHQGLEREYYLYVPENIDPHRPLVVMLHGYGGKAATYRPEMLETAQKHGFALCVPQGWPSPKDGKPGWNVRYPRQEGLTTDDVAFVRKLVAKLQKEYNLSKDATFLTGMSNGGEMCYLFAWLHPETFTSIASVAGLTMAWLPDEHRLKDAHVPFLEIHGTADHTSEWTGDPSGEFGWGAYLAVPQAVGNIVAMNGCTYEKVEELPLKKADSHRIVLHRYLGGRDEVRLYEVQGGAHNWALDDIDTTEMIWDFFSQSLK